MEPFALSANSMCGHISIDLDRAQHRGHNIAIISCNFLQRAKFLVAYEDVKGIYKPAAFGSSSKRDQFSLESNSAARNFNKRLASSAAFRAQQRSNKLQSFPLFLFLSLSARLFRFSALCMRWAEGISLPAVLFA